MPDISNCKDDKKISSINEEEQRIVLLRYQNNYRHSHECSYGNIPQNSAGYYQLSTLV